MLSGLKYVWMYVCIYALIERDREGWEAVAKDSSQVIISLSDVTWWLYVCVCVCCCFSWIYFGAIWPAQLPSSARISSYQWCISDVLTWVSIHNLWPEFNATILSLFLISRLVFSLLLLFCLGFFLNPFASCLQFFVLFGRCCRCFLAVQLLLLLLLVIIVLPHSILHPFSPASDSISIHFTSFNYVMHRH